MLKRGCGISSHAGVYLVRDMDLIPYVGQITHRSCVMRENHAGCVILRETYFNLQFFIILYIIQKEL